jgi:type I restriction enzyme, R subunit
VAKFIESVVEEAALAWFAGLGYAVKGGAEISPDGLFAERSDFGQVILEGRLREALARFNPGIPAEALEEALRKVVRLEGADLITRNRQFHLMLVNGVTVEYRHPDGSIRGAPVKLADFEDPENSDWLVVNQFSVIENKDTRRPDILIFLNGMPMGTVELKNAADEKTDLWEAFKQVQTYKARIPTLMSYNEAIVISDGLYARVGTLSSDRERFQPWRTIEGREVAESHLPELQVAIEGVFDKRRFLDLLRYFIVFEDEGGGKLTKKMAGYHQFHAVNVAIKETVRAVEATHGAMTVAEPRGFYAGEQIGAEKGDRRIGVVWHTQGSGKSLTMAFYAGRVILHPEMNNPTIVVLTDRNDLDGQLFGVFSRCRDLLRQEPVQAETRAHLRQLLDRQAGGVIFTTVQKFFPEEKGDRHPVLSERRNIVVIADEAHRSQYDFIDGFARHLRDAIPNASFIAFTGTPIEKADANTRSVFGEYISIYDIKRSVEDGATVPIFYESRLAKLELNEAEKPKIDPDFEEATEGEEVEKKEKLKSKWAQLEAVVGAEKRVKLIAQDIVEHWEERLAGMPGKLYNEIVALRPEWHDEDDEKGAIKVVMTGSATDPADWQDHIRNKARRERLAERFKDPEDYLKMVLVRDMWLTGFDAPSLHTMYMDKPMRGHGLMQAIARVNRVFKEKPGGLIVDYLGLAHELKQALAVYTDSGGHGEPVVDQEEAVAVMLEKYEVCCSMLHGFDWLLWTTGNAQQRLSLLPPAQEVILKQEDGKARFVLAVMELSKAFALSVPHPEALRIRDDVGFFQAIRAALLKRDVGKRRSQEEMDLAIQQIVSRAVASDTVIDVFSAAGLKKPDISILSDEFLAEVQGMEHRNVAVELLQKLLEGEIKLRSRRNLVQSRSFAELLEQSIRRYQNRAIEAAQVIEELIALAKEIREADRRGEELGLSEDELAFYDALETNDSAVKVLGDDTLRTIAQELVKTVRENVSIDWTVRENVRANLRVMVKRILRKYGYPPDKQERATDTVLQQAEVLSAGWAA